VAEAYVFQSITVYAHFAWATALMLCILTELMLLADRPGHAAAWIRLAASSFVLAWVHPRLLLPMGVMGSGIAVLGHWGRLWSWRFWVLPMAIFGIAAGIPAAVMWISARGYLIVETTPTPPFYQIVQGYGLLWPLAVFGLIWAVRKNRRLAVAAGGWMIVGLALIHAPIAAQRRLLHGYNIPLAILAGVAVGERFWPWLCSFPRLRRREAAAMVVFLSVAVSLSSFDYLSMLIRHLKGGQYPWYYSIQRQEAFEWLRDHTPRDSVVLCSDQSGQLIPAMTGNRVVSGHWGETYNRAEKIAHIEEYFDPRTSTERRIEIERLYRVRYIFLSPLDRWSIAGPNPNASLFDPSTEPRRWKQVWARGDIQIFEAIGENP
jgi:hypothetical protein